MALSAGEKLGPYEVVAPLGAGGMGEVYKARDTRLDRSVAVKVLPEHIAKRDDLRLRFEREARAVASLNHPHICTLYDIGPNYMVMELIEGETLAARIDKGAIPLEQALAYATQTADALDRAHRAGVTHRDIKPQNIMLTRDGVKVLDFGLAKSTAKPGPTEETLTKVLTTEGTVLGTPQYMAPEQFEGKEADARSDIWAFGGVLYEMVTGRKAFEGRNYTSLVAAILGGEPAPMAVKPFTPAWLERLVRRCLEKEPEDRYQSMRDIVLDLKSPPAETAGTAAQSNRWWQAVAAVAVVVAGLFAALWAALWLRNGSGHATPAQELIRIDADLGPDVTINAGNSSGVILSRDGARLAYVGEVRGQTAAIYTRRLDQPTAVALPGTEGASNPFFSPDGQWIAFVAGGKLKKIQVEGGAAITLCDARPTVGGSWGEDGNIVAALNIRGSLSLIPSAGGTPKPFTTLVEGEVTHRWPQILPGGKGVLFVSHTQSSGYEEGTLVVVTAEDGKRKKLYKGASWGRYLPSGHLVFMNNGTLLAMPFDLESLETKGDPTPVLEDVSLVRISGAAQFDFSQTGMAVYRKAGYTGNQATIQWLEPSGRTSPALSKPGDYRTVQVSPDGKRLALEFISGGNSDIWVYDIPRDTMTRLTFDAVADRFPVWSPDGRHIFYRNGDALAVVRSDGGGSPQVLTEEKSPQSPNSMTPDGKRLAYTEGGDLWTLPLESDGESVRAGKPEPFHQSSFEEVRPTFSNDGKWLAYGSNESGSFEIYVRAFPDTGARWQVSNEGGTLPVFSPNGRELFYRTAGGVLMAASYRANGGSFLADKPHVWSEKRPLDMGSAPNFDPAPDGKRMAILDSAATTEGKPESELTFLFHFFDELRRKAPTGGGK